MTMWMQTMLASNMGVRDCCSWLIRWLFFLWRSMFFCNIEHFIKFANWPHLYVIWYSFGLGWLFGQGSHRHSSSRASVYLNLLHILLCPYWVLTPPFGFGFSLILCSSSVHLLLCSQLVYYLRSHPNLLVHTNLVDSHCYVLSKAAVFEILKEKDELVSIRTELLPHLVRRQARRSKGECDVSKTDSMIASEDLVVFLFWRHSLLK